MIYWMGSAPLSAEVEMLVSNRRFPVMLHFTVMNFRPCGSLRMFMNAKMWLLVIYSGSGPSVLTTSWLLRRVYLGWKTSLTALCLLTTLMNWSVLGVGSDSATLA